MPDVELPPPAPDGKIWLTTTQAALAARVSKSAISTWKAEGLLRPHPDSPPRRPLYALDDVLDAERARRRKAIEDGHGYWAQRRPGLRKARTGKRKAA